MIPGVDLVDFITYVGLIGVALVIFAESGLLIGFFLPGDSLLFTTGFLIYAGVLQADIHVVVAVLFLAAVLGDSTGYLFGKKLGPRIFKRENSLLFHKKNVERAAAFYEKHGGKTVILARFVPIVRTFAPVLAGVGTMPYRQFLLYNVIGAFLWAVGVTYLGYFAGSWFESIGLEIDQVLLPMIAVIILLSVAPVLFHILRDKSQRDAIKTAIGQRISYSKNKLKK